MSHSTVYGLWPGQEKRVRLAEFRNAWGMAPVVWNIMAQAYLHVKPHEYWQHMDAIWPLAERDDIWHTNRAVLKMTFDTRYILAKDVPRAIDDIALFLHQHQALIDPTAANHWPAYGNALVTQWASKPPAFGVHQTSVSENTWEGPYDEKLDRRLPFDWSTASSVYEE